jgi:hypothetical protein
MIKKLIHNRYSARTWSERPIEKSKVDYIVDCALHAPSKQSLYPYKIYLLHDSQAAVEFKEWLYWEQTWCVDGNIAKPEDRGSDDKIFNGQYRAPLLLLWVHRIPDKEYHLNNNYWPHYIQKHQEENLIDMTVSASFAMLAAEESGIRTCFGRCHPHFLDNTPLEDYPINIGIALGIGYAEDDSWAAVPYEDEVVYPIYRNNKLEGLEPKNLPQSFPRERHVLRRNKPDLNILHKFV